MGLEVSVMTVIASVGWTAGFVETADVCCVTLVDINMSPSETSADDGCGSH